MLEPYIFCLKYKQFFCDLWILMLHQWKPTKKAFVFLCRYFISEKLHDWLWVFPFLHENTYAMEKFSTIHYILSLRRFMYFHYHQKHLYVLLRELSYMYIERIYESIIPHSNREYHSITHSPCRFIYLSIRFIYKHSI